MSSRKQQLEGLKGTLSKMEWPALYPFKFIVPIEKLDEVLELFEKAETRTKISRKGNYVSVSATPFMYDSEKVIEIYTRALRIDGLLAL